MVNSVNSWLDSISNTGVRVKCQGKTPLNVLEKESFTLALYSDPTDTVTPPTLVCLLTV